MAISIAKAKSLCNASEMSLITASTPQEIGKLSAARLRQKVLRARELRDKWRDQAARQRRTEQERHAARQTAAAKRSAEKAQLFDEALTRFEKQLAKNPDQEGTVAARKAAPKKTRTKQHRASRAAVRDELAETRRALNTGRQPRKAAITDEAASIKPEPQSAAVRVEEKKPAADTGAAVKKTRSRSAGPPPAPKGLTKLAAVQGLRTNKRKQSLASTAAKTNRLQTSAKTRIQQHLSARTKRAQARRDAR